MFEMIISNSLSPKCHSQKCLRYDFIQIITYGTKLELFICMEIEIKMISIKHFNF